MYLDDYQDSIRKYGRNDNDRRYCYRYQIWYDILIFTLPNEPNTTYIKRVIGLPGETVEVKNGKVYADGVELDDSFTNGPMNRRGDGVYLVPEGCYFFLGDNRNQSKDSRFWKEKYIPIENIQAKARYIVYPFNRAGHIE